ncbi:DUF2062 domain-containing protein [Synechococcus moorigangaii CMS01]|nr:DUF2062 domain-containing protein [Synechococcus moorigangaii CMS01]
MITEKTPSRKGSESRLSRWRRWGRYWYLKVLRQEGTPEAIARGWACGVFAGSFPLFGLQTIIGLLLATAFRGNKLTAAAGTWVSNPFTYVPIFYFNFQVGEVLLQQQNTFEDGQLESWSELSLAGMNFVSTLFFGSMVVGVGLATGAYFLSLWLMYRWRSLRAARQFQRRTLPLDYR